MLPTRGKSIPSAADAAAKSDQLIRAKKSPPVQEDFFATKRRHAKLLCINVLFFFAVALLVLAFLWTVFHLLENYNKFYNDNAKLHRDSVQLITQSCRYQRRNVVPSVVLKVDTPNDEDALHPELQQTKLQLDSMYDTQNQQILQAEQALNEICNTAREHANMNVGLKSKNQAVTELLRHLWPINWFACTPGDPANSCHYAIFTSLNYLTHSPTANAPPTQDSGKVDVFNTPLQMINDLVKIIALAVMIGTVLLVILLMFCHRSAKYAVHMGAISLLVLITGTSLIWNAVLTLWAMVKLVAACLCCVILLMGPVLSIIKYTGSTRLVRNLEDRFKSSKDVQEKPNVFVQQTVEEHALSDTSGLFSTTGVTDLMQQAADLFPNRMFDWQHHTQIEGGAANRRPYYTLPAVSKTHVA